MEQNDARRVYRRRFASACDRPWLSTIEVGSCHEMIASRRVARSAAVLNLALAAAVMILQGTAAHASRWTVYHHDRLGTGVYKPTIDLSSAHQVWRSPVLQGQLYGEPLVNGNYIYVATTADVVYALRAADGTVAWSKTVGTPVPAEDLPCGNISPTVGIVGTPVIDPSRHEIFAVADELVNGTPHHYLVGLDTTTGKLLLSQNVDPPGSTPAAQLQRTGLNLVGEAVVFGFGGNAGDCSTYHGWIISVPEAGGEPKRFEVDAGASQGAVWMGGAAPVVDGSKHVWVATGNGSTTSGDPLNSDSVLKLSAGMELLDSFTPAGWAHDNAADLDLGSTSPVLLPGQVVQVGKSQTAYVLKRGNLGGVGGQQLTVSPICGTTFDGGSAFIESTVYLPCRNGTISATVGRSPVSLTVNWKAAISSAGPPILAGGSVWVIDQSGHLDGLDPSTGAITQQLSIGSTANHFPTASVGDGLLLAPAANTVVAFAG
jgi:outer membrane protein assembly factor BamB